ncbi:Transportin MOS14 [Diplonema papillatum]|nr:Transportin MOS14 [Diplonema papillatum]
MAAITTAEVKDKIVFFYRPDLTPEQRKASDNWLQDFRRHDAAWGICDELLQIDDMTVQAFAATSLQWRVKNAKPDVSVGKQLQQCILGHIVRLRNGKKAVLETLCSAFVELLQLRPNPGVVQELWSSLKSPETVTVFLLFLDVLGDRAGRVLGDLEEGAEAERADAPEISKDHPLLVTVQPNVNVVLGLLHEVWQHIVPGTQDFRSLKVPPGMEQATASVFAVFAKWLRFFEMGGADENQVASSPIVMASIPAMNRHDLCDPACDLLSEVAILATDRQSAKLLSLLEQAAAPLMEFRAASTADDDLSVVLTKALSRVCRVFCPLLNHQTFQSTKFMIHAADHPNQRVFHFTVGYWRTLRKAVSTARQADAAQIEQAVADVMAPFVPVLLKLSMFPTESDTWKPDDDDEFEFDKFRSEDLSEAVHECGQLLGEVKAVQIAFPMLTQSLQTSRWAECESVLFFIAAIRHTKTLRDELLAELFKQTAPVASQHWRVQAQYITIIGQEGDWLRCSAPHYIPGLIDFIAHCLNQQPRLQAAAIDAIGALCETCPAQVVQLYPVLQKGAASWTELNLPEAKSLMTSLGCLVCDLPEADLLKAIEGFCTPSINRIQSVGADKVAISREIKKLEALFRGADKAANRSKKDVADAIGKSWATAWGGMWPFINTMMTNGSVESDATLFEELLSLVRNAVLACGKEFLPHLESLINTIVASYQRKPQSSILWLVGTIVNVFGKKPELALPLSSVVNELVGPTLEILSKSDPGVHSDMIQELFYVMSMCVKNFPKELFASPLAVTFFNVGTACMLNTDVTRDALSEVIQYFREITDPYAAPELASSIPAFLDSRGDALLSAMLFVVVRRDLDNSDYVGDVLINLKATFPHKLMQWVHHGLASLPAEVPAAARESCLHSLNAGTQKEHAILERLHRDTPSNWR